MNANVSVSEQCRIAASNGNQILGMIRGNITYKENELIIPLYKAIDRSHLEYSIQAWRPYLRKDMDISGVSRGVFWLPGTPPPPSAMILFNQGVTPILTLTFTSHLDL